jgi:BASS family bile acid:Na+ symporter
VEAVTALFNIVLVVFIVATMASAGFNTTFEQIAGVLKNLTLVGLVLIVALVLRPLVGWGSAELFGLGTAAFIATVLLWSIPGAPLGVKFVAMAKGDVQSGAVLQVLIAVVASITFAPTANAIIGAADLGDDFSLPVGQILGTIAFLQLVPFGVGVLVRHWSPDTALEWDEPVSKAAGVTFVAVVAGAILGSWETIVDLVGSATLLAAILASVVMIVLGYFISTGESATRRATGLIQVGSNSGPAFAAVAIAFGNDPEILGAVTAIVFMQIVVGIVVASFLGRKTEGPAGQPSAAGT